MTFVLVDYKGGAAFSVASDLPHTVGLVTDLDQHLVERALRSLRAELTRREHILAASGAKDIEDHEAHLARGGAGEQMPRLVLVIDEFAAMVAELPDFVTGLIGIAQRGRSLGVHLILATQRPGGVVGPDIRANTNLRVALRMTDSGESTDVIDVADAARIPKSVPGRAFARLGHSSVVPFQSARVGGRWAGEEDPATGLPFVRVLDWRDFATAAPARPSRSDQATAATDLSVLVQAMGDARDRLGIGRVHSPWLPPLPELLPLAGVASAAVGSRRETSSTDDALRFAVGLEDLPDTQEQRAAEVDLARFTHQFVVGAPGSGRSTALRTLAASAARSLSSADLHVYAIDCGNGALASLQQLPHCGAVVQRTQVERATRLIDRLTRETARRHDLIAAASAADITEQRLLAAPGERLPHVLVLIDRWENFTTSLGEVDGGALTDAVQVVAPRRCGRRDPRRRGRRPVAAVVADVDPHRRQDRAPADRPAGLLARRHQPPEAARVDPGRARVPRRLGYRGALRDARHRRVRPGADHRRAGPRRGAPRHLAGPAVAASVPGGRDAEGPGPRHRASRSSPLRYRPRWSPSPGSAGTTWSCRPSTCARVAARSWSPGRRGPAAPRCSPRWHGRSWRAGRRSSCSRRDRDPCGTSRGCPVCGRCFSGDDVTQEQLGPVLAPDGAPLVLVVDDGELLIDCSAARWLRDWGRAAVDNGQGMLLGGNTTGLAAGFGGWQVDAKKNRRGALLSPQDTLAGDLIGVRIARSSISSRIEPGSALVHLGTGLASTLQVPMVPAGTRAGTQAWPRAGTESGALVG